MVSQQMARFAMMMVVHPPTKLIGGKLMLSKEI
jgi:hypothetical protein